MLETSGAVRNVIACYVARMSHDSDPSRSHRAAQRRGFGRLRKLPSGRYQAAYVGPDARVHKAPTTFETKVDAEGWLAQERRLIDRDDWSAPAVRHAARYTRGLTVNQYADQWVENHRRTDGSPLKPRTKAHYRKVLDSHVRPGLGDIEVRHLTPERIEQWHAELGAGTPTMRAHAYAVLRTMLQSATRGSAPLLQFNPCQMPGAGNSKRVHQIEPASLTELEALVTGMPGRYRVMVLLAAWCGLRYGELAELRRKDVVIRSKKLKITRGVVKMKGRFVVGTPKSDAGSREVAIPPHLMPLIEQHLTEHTDTGRDALLFPAHHGGHLSQSTLFRHYEKARTAAGRPDLRFHDLRHTGAVLAAQTGATLAELMGRLGHSTPQAAMRYQHAARDRDREIADLLSKMVEGRHAAE
ncbi:tyrosine-type recombinase/integrase [Enemella evansiae]|uniref:tyrosine-type recombinase/integrase n=1 Tax=Enemella evansiae TaxID=2016499 RepID=UPI001E326C70|nr:site-specific integrase [Enemella evansiae]